MYMMQFSCENNVYVVKSPWAFNQNEFYGAIHKSYVLLIIIYSLNGGVSKRMAHQTKMESDSKRMWQKRSKHSYGLGNGTP